MPLARTTDDTPAMRQYRRFKERHPDCVLFFRMGDFYEMFHEDAKLAHRVLGVTLTQRTEGVPMAGVPYHAVENYLRRMISAGYRVAVCDQVEDPALAKTSGAGIVKREVTRVITPGTLTDESLLEDGRENPLAAVVLAERRASLAWAELSTGAFRVMSVGAEELADELARISPRELLVIEDDKQPVKPPAGCAVTKRPAWQFRQAEAIEALCRQFGVAQLDGFGFSHDDPVLAPAAAIVHYLLETQVTNRESENPQTLSHLRPPSRLLRDEHLVIDQVSLRSLEIEQTTRAGGTEGTLLGAMLSAAGGGGCRTAMGKRMLRQWLCYPLRQRDAIETRQRLVGAMVHDSRFLGELRQVLDGVQDVQRIMARISVGRATPRDLAGLGASVRNCGRLAALLDQRPAAAAYHATLARLAGPLTELADLLAAACVDHPPAHLRDGGLIRDGYDAALDEFRGLQRDSHSWLAGYQKTLIEQTAIASLKVGFNKIFGYYIELTASNRDKAPAGWSRKQTLKNAERFITPELKEFEGKVLSAQSRAVAREQELFGQLCERAQARLEALHQFAQSAAELDALSCFARRAARFRYVRPTIVNEPVLRIKAGRHPVLDELLGDQFVPNDVELRSGAPRARAGFTESIPEARGASLALITGPNMAGKSTYIRQAALLTLLAHTGSFVPAEEATVGLCDRIFTRIGASDELHTGQSTFMIEMTETANICHHATPASLVILDEIGRGTSTLDGLSLAWAIAEHLAARGCRTLFATHYHELTALADRFENVTNLNVTVREWKDQIVFLHRIAPGGTNRSYGIHVAKIAGLPPEVVKRAHELLEQLEVNHHAPDKTAQPQAAGQMPLFTEYVEHPALQELRDADLNALSPMQAFDLLRKLRGRLDQ